jgi:hypothetical protein
LAAGRTIPVSTFHGDFVYDSDSDTVYVVCKSRALRRRLKRDLAARRRWLEWRTWAIRYSGEEELAAVLTALRDTGVPFLDTPGGWPPAGIFRYLREKGLVTGKVTAVSWRGPGQPFTFEM